MAIGLLELLLPTRCAGCGVPGAACCRTCAAVWGSLGQVTRGPTADLAPVYSLTPYRGVARRLVLAYKERGRRDLTATLGKALAEAVSLLPIQHAADGTVWLVPVPSRKRAARARGGPHMHRLARSCAVMLARAGTPVAVAPALTLDAAARDAVGLTREERAANLSGRLRLCPAGAAPPTTPVVLIDDVITTGATAAACARVLADGGMMVTAILTLTAT